MKISIDYHGVLNKEPFFKEMARLFVKEGHEVHILTGAMWTNKVKEEFGELGLIKGINYTHFASVSQMLIQNGENVKWEDSNNPWFDSETWNKTKGEYCKENDICMHFDDTKEYADFFKTPFYFKLK